MRKKPEAEDRFRQILKVAHLFYEKEMTKTDISHEIRASTTQVARLLEEARELGFVRVEFTPPRLHKLGEQLRGKYAWLRDATVISYAEDLVFLRRMLGKAAADYFSAQVAEGATVAIGGGDTMYEMVMALPQTERDLFFVPAAIIDSGPALTHIDPIVLLTLLWVRSGRKPRQAHFATGLPFNKPLSRQKLKEEYDEFCKRRAVQEALAKMKQADYLFTSLGCLQPDPAYEQLAPRPHKYLLENLRLNEATLKREGVVGDINYSFFDAQGQTSTDWHIFPSIGVSQAQEMVKSGKEVVVAAGRYKLASLKSAINGRLFNVLITDEMAAKELLNSE